MENFLLGAPLGAVATFAAGLVWFILKKKPEQDHFDESKEVLAIAERLHDIVSRTDPYGKPLAYCSHEDLHSLRDLITTARNDIVESQRKQQQEFTNAVNAMRKSFDDVVRQLES